MMTRLVLALLVALAACGTAKPGGMSGPSMNNKMGGDALAPPPSRVISQDILAREPVANRAGIKHILVGWKDLAGNYGGNMDARAAGRTKAEAEAVVEGIMGQLQGGADFDQLMGELSEDRASAASGTPINVTPDAGLVIEFKQMGLRLNVGEIGVVESQFGFHVMKRVE